GTRTTRSGARRPPHRGRLRQLVSGRGRRRDHRGRRGPAAVLGVAEVRAAKARTRLRRPPRDRVDPRPLRPCGLRREGTIAARHPGLGSPRRRGARRPSPPLRDRALPARLSVAAEGGADPRPHGRRRGAVGAGHLARARLRLRRDAGGARPAADHRHPGPHPWARGAASARPRRADRRRRPGDARSLHGAARAAAGGPGGDRRLPPRPGGARRARGDRRMARLAGPRGALRRRGRRSRPRSRGGVRV
ncbi:MAG: MBL-fold metallo-hydrolase superfamily, partial [uncultured Solirubrobacteraceae bacterium]